MRGLRARGVDCHIGSQLTRLGPLAAALRRVAGLYRVLRGEGHPLEWLDVGGGLGIRYRDEAPPSPDRWAATVRAATRDTGATVLVEPGRVLVGNAGVLLTRVLYRKRAGGRMLVVVDAGMNDLLRPALYGAEHAIVPVRLAEAGPGGSTWWARCASPPTCWDATGSWSSPSPGSCSPSAAPARTA
jgi:diaminopimelate decarboxylase